MNELSKNLMCVQMRSGVEIWLEAEKAETLQKALQGITQSKFVMHEGQTINTADIVGVFFADTMSDHTRRKNGEYQCPKGTWHTRNQKCDCREAAAQCEFCGVFPCPNPDSDMCKKIHDELSGNKS